MVKEAKIREYFRPASLLVYLAPLWKAAVDLICAKSCHKLHEEWHPDNWANAATALTHPEIFGHSIHDRRGGGGPFYTVTGVSFLFDYTCALDANEEISVMDEIQNYLCDKERAGMYFVDGGMYATLCLRLFKFVLASDTL